DAGAVTLLSAGATAAVITLVTGFPEGWHPLSGQVVSWLGWLSLPLDLVYVVRYIDGYSHAYIVTVGHHLQHQLATAALGLTAVVLVGCWLAALRGRPWAWLAAALGGAVLCSTAVESWYLLWPFFVVALLARRRRDLAIIAAVSLGFVFGMGPEGYAITHNVAAVPLFGIAGAAAALWLRRWDLARPAAGSVTPPPSGAPR
ncbi:MAG: hypothetical protein ACTHMS_19500, partial [Jatrophihabitans sp.]|uniref:hypothetical protein n=1 Tax=Jatrophihabitans sp. TaxID=1932789 RepID=UPI003F81D8F9